MTTTTTAKYINLVYTKHHNKFGKKIRYSNDDDNRKNLRTTVKWKITWKQRFSGRPHRLSTIGLNNFNIIILWEKVKMRFNRQWNRLNTIKFLSWTCRGVPCRPTRPKIAKTCQRYKDVYEIQKNSIKTSQRAAEGSLFKHLLISAQDILTLVVFIKCFISKYLPRLWIRYTALRITCGWCMLNESERPRNMAELYMFYQNQTYQLKVVRRRIIEDYVRQNSGDAYWVKPEYMDQELRATPPCSIQDWSGSQPLTDIGGGLPIFSSNEWRPITEYAFHKYVTEERARRCIEAELWNRPTWVQHWDDACNMTSIYVAQYIHLMRPAAQRGAHGVMSQLPNTTQPLPANFGLPLMRPRFDIESHVNRFFRQGRRTTPPYLEHQHGRVFHVTDPDCLYDYDEVPGIFTKSDKKCSSFSEKLWEIHSPNYTTSYNREHKIVGVYFTKSPQHTPKGKDFTFAYWDVHGFDIQPPEDWTALYYIFM